MFSNNMGSDMSRGTEPGVTTASGAAGVATPTEEEGFCWASAPSLCLFKPRFMYLGKG